MFLRFGILSTRGAGKGKAMGLECVMPTSITGGGGLSLKIPWSRRDGVD